TRAIWMDDGRIVADGHSKNVVEAYLAEQHAQDRASLGQQIFVQSNVVPAPIAVPKPEIGVASQRVGTAMESFPFDPDREHSEFGARAVEVQSARLIDAGSGDAKHVYGGENVILHISARVHRPITGVIFGFYVKNRLGQRLFGENSYLAYCDQPVRVE